MSSFLGNLFFLLILSMIISISSVKIKIDGSQRDYCFTKTIYDKEDTMKISFLISSGKRESVNITFKNKNGKILYQEVYKQKDEYLTDVLPSGDYTLCFSPREQTIYYINPCDAVQYFLND